MMHLLAFSGAKTDSTANEAAPALADNAFSRTANGNQYLAPKPLNIIAACAFNDTITRARLNYPSYRDIGLPEISPLNALAIPSADFDMCVWGDNGPRVRETEEMGVDSSNGASTVDTIHAGLWLRDRFEGVPPGRRTTVRGTAAITLATGAWASGSLVLDQTLPYGRYGLIGMEAVCVTCAFIRLIFPNSPQWRPGVVAGGTIAIRDPLQWARQGKLGLLGTFDQTAPPQVEGVGTTAGAQTASLILDLVELRGNG